MGIAIKCILEREIPDVPCMEGKSLAMGYCSDACGGVDSNADIIAIDFRSGTIKPRPKPASSAEKSVLSPLDAFISGDAGIQWHDAATGLAAVKNILRKLDEGAIIMTTPDFEFCDDDQELTEGVQYDLEELEQILEAAHKAQAKFYLAFDV